jgi:5'-nucleotidase
MPHTATGVLTSADRRVDGVVVRAFAVDASPALAVQHGILEVADRQPALIVSGINFGANLSTDVTISGTVGAALEASAFGIPALAVSLEMDPQHYLTGDANAHFAAAQAYTLRFAAYTLSWGMPYGADVLSINIPSDGAPETAWRYTHLSRYRYFTPLPPDRATLQGRPGYRIIEHPEDTEPDSDLRAVLVDRIVSVTPLSLDLTAHPNIYLFEQPLTADLADLQMRPLQPSVPASFALTGAP